MKMGFGSFGKGSVGFVSTLALGILQVGTSWAWVNNTGGMILNGSQPVQVSAGSTATCKKTSTGVTCRGTGALGNGTISSNSNYVQTIAGAKAVETAVGNTCIIDSANALKCFGDNANGKLGNGNAVSQTALTTVIGLSPVSSVAMGSNHTCAQESAGIVKCWGLGTSGQLGNGSNASSSSPVQVMGLGGTAKLYALGEAHTCAAVEVPGNANQHELKCWGSNAAKITADAAVGFYPTPQLISVGAPIRSLAAAGNNTCFIQDLKLKCFGVDFGPAPVTLLGTGITPPSGSDVSLTASDLTVSQVDMEVNGFPSTTNPISVNICVLANYSGLTGTAVYCRGNNFYYQFGAIPSVPGNVLSPTAFYALSTSNSGFSQLSVGKHHTCGVRNGAAYCWGSNQFAQISSTTDTFSFASPALASGVSQGYTQLAPGSSGDHHCATNSTGGINCWGSNFKRALGFSNSYPSLLATAVSNRPGHPATDFGSGMGKTIVMNHRTCSIKVSDGSLKCWGTNVNTHSSTEPCCQVQYATQNVFPDTLFNLIDVAAHTNIGMSVGDTATLCVIKGASLTSPSGNVLCWGYNDFGQVGTGAVSSNFLNQTPGPIASPLQVAGLPSTELFTKVAVGRRVACAITAGGRLWCWGKGTTSSPGWNLAPWSVGSIAGAVTTDVVVSEGATEDRVCYLSNENTAQKRLRCFSPSSNPNPNAVIPNIMGSFLGATKVSMASNEICVVNNGSVSCFTGAIIPASSVTWTPLAGATTVVTDLRIHSGGKCFVQNGLLKCVGSNAFGQGGSARPFALTSQQAQ